MERDTEMQHLKSLNQIRLEDTLRYPDIVNDHLKYTSLKDILPNSPTNCVPNFAVNGFDIAIRNQLVKQAASAYLQSAAILTSRNQNWLVRFWRKLAIKAALRSYWRNYVRDPLEACVSPIYQLFACLLQRIHVPWSRIVIP